MNVTANYPNRPELTAFLQRNREGISSAGLLQDAASCLDEFKSDSGDQLVQDLQKAQTSTLRKTFLGVLGGGALALAGVFTGMGAAAALIGGGVAAASVVLGSKRMSKLGNFGLFMAAAKLDQTLQHATARPQAQTPPPRAQAPNVEAEPTPRGWKPGAHPKEDVLIDMHPDGGYTVYSRPLPPDPEPPKTVTVIDMKPDQRGVFVADTIRQYTA